MHYSCGEFEVYADGKPYSGFIIQAEIFEDLYLFNGGLQTVNAFLIPFYFAPFFLVFMV